MSSLREDQVIYKNEHGLQQVQKKPAWANDDRLVLSDEDVSLFNNTEFSVPEHMGFNGNVLRDVLIVTRGDGDLIYHFPNTRNKDFKALLSAVVEAHFGSLDNFRVDHIHEMKLWSLLGKGVRKNPLFNMKHYTEDFLWLLDGTLEEASKE